MEFHVSVCRKPMTGRTAVALLAALTMAGLWAFEASVSAEQAERIASDRLDSYCESFDIDRELLHGPERIRLEDPGFIFEWVAFGGADPVRLEVWVSDSGRPEVGPSLGIERLVGSR